MTFFTCSWHLKKFFLQLSGLYMVVQQTPDDVLAPAQPPRYFWQIYELFNIHDTKFDGVSFSAMLQQFPKVIGLFVVVAFGSSLDVAAIQADSPEPLDYNHELKTVGEAHLAPFNASCDDQDTILKLRKEDGIMRNPMALFACIARLEPYLLPVLCAFRHRQ